MGAYAEIFEVPNDWATYEKITAELGDDRRAGLIVHAASPTANGVRMVNVWESREAREQFGERLAQARAKVGVEPVEFLRHEDFDVEDLVKG